MSGLGSQRPEQGSRTVGLDVGETEYLLDQCGVRHYPVAFTIGLAGHEMASYVLPGPGVYRYDDGTPIELR